MYCSFQEWRERWKRPLLLNSASGSVFPPVLYCDFFSLCAGHYLDVALVVYVCVWMQALSISLCLPCCENLCSWGLSLCVPVYLCVSTHVFTSCFCVFDVLGLKDASACACLYAANVCVFMPLRCVYVFQWACFHKPPAYQYWRVCKGLIMLHVSPWCDTFLQFTGRWLTVSVSCMLLGAE